MSAITPEKFTTADVNAALRQRYTQPEWALMFEVAASTGWAGRYADAVAMNMYPSRGLALHGFEVKVSRSDWQRELKKPEKAEAISRYCDYWWLVTVPDIVKDGELPLGWGLMELRGGVLKIKVRAAERETVPVDRNFMAAMLRRGYEVDNATVTKLVNDGLEGYTFHLRRELEGQVRRALEEKKLFDESMTKLKEACGIDLRDCLMTDRLAGWLKLARSLDMSGDYGPLMSALREIRRARTGMTKVEEALELALSNVNGEVP